MIYIPTSIYIFLKPAPDNPLSENTINCLILKKKISEKTSYDEKFINNLLYFIELFLHSSLTLENTGDV